MAMGRPKAKLVVSATDREQLEGWANSRSLPAGLVNRITQRAIRRGTFQSAQELVAKIDHFVRSSNAHPQPFVWTAPADSILPKIERRCNRISATAH